MALKKKNLAAALADTPVEVVEASAVPSNATPRQTTTARSSREGMTNIASWFPMAVKFQLDELQLRLSRERGKKVTLTQLQAEAYNDIFKKYGMAEIAPGSEG